jgi:hypothetical protein
MSYQITSTHNGVGAVDERPTVNSALQLARALLAEGAQGVAISDNTGNSISGADLAACCNGEKTIGADLRSN